MHKCDRDGAFAHRGRYSLDVTAANVPDCEDTRTTRLEKVRRSLEGPLCGAEIFGQNIRSGFDEAAVIECDAAVEPLRRGDRSGHHKEMPDGLDRLSSGNVVAA